MSLYAISDLHLALSIDKPMDVFGSRWSNYMARLEAEWNGVVGGDDCVVIPGDISWATYLEQAYDDFMFIERLPGRKIILKGNHDYWWTTMSKLDRFLTGNAVTSVSFMHNNSIRVGDTVLCGTRGWNLPGDGGFTAEDERIYRRELARLELSLKEAVKEGVPDIIAALHYPPFNSKGEPSDFVGIMKKYRVGTCLYGHLHGESLRNAVEGEVEGIEFRLVSADYLGFRPAKIRK